MYSRLIPLLIAIFTSLNVYAFNSDNPFAKNDTVSIGKDVQWKINKQTLQAVKTAADSKGNYYHLSFDRRSIIVSITTDEGGNAPKSFNQLEVKNLKIDGKQNALFNWCLNNQQRHNRFLQQGLTVKKNVCTIDGVNGSFAMQLDKRTLDSLVNGKRLSVMLKPFRTPVELNYDISDFKDMQLALTAKQAKAVAVKPASSQGASKCWAGPPAKYKSIKPVEYDCNDASAKKEAEAWITKLVNKEKAKEVDAEKLAAAKAAEKEKQKKLAEKQRQKQLAEQKKMADIKQQEAAAIAASEAKQASLNNEITQKMVGVCNKFWSKGEHRCYCQKYISHAPADIQSNSTCN